MHAQQEWQRTEPPHPVRRNHRTKRQQGLGPRRAFGRLLQAGTAGSVGSPHMLNRPCEEARHVGGSKQPTATLV